MVAKAHLEIRGRKWSVICHRSGNKVEWRTGASSSFIPDRYRSLLGGTQGRFVDTLRMAWATWFRQTPS